MHEWLLKNPAGENAGERSPEEKSGAGGLGGSVISGIEGRGPTRRTSLAGGGGVAIELGRKEPVRQTLLLALRIYDLKKSGAAPLRLICNVLIVPSSSSRRRGPPVSTTPSVFLAVSSFYR